MDQLPLHRIVSVYFPTEDPAEVAVLQRLQQGMELEAGQPLFTAGDTAEFLALVIRGRFAVQKPIGVGSRTQVVALLDPGTMIGEGALFDGRHRGSTVVAVAPSTVVLFHRAALIELESTLPHLYVALVKKLLAITSLRLQKSSDRLALVL